MTKVFISVPMKGRTKDQIINSINAMHEIAEVMAGESLQPVHNFDHVEAPDGVIDRLYYLGGALKLLSECDYIICTDDWRFDGCRIERMAAEAYGITILDICMRNMACFNDIVPYEIALEGVTNGCNENESN